MNASPRLSSTLLKRLVHQRTDLVNALRAILYEYGHAVAQGIHHLPRIKERSSRKPRKSARTGPSRMPGPYRPDCMEDGADRGQDRAAQETGGRD